MGPRLASLLLVFGLMAAPARAAQPVVLGQVALSVHMVAGAVVQQVLEALGHPVRVVEEGEAELFPRLARGEVHLLAAAWLPSADAEYLQRYGGETVEITTLYRGARLLWTVPAYVPASEVASVDDLARLEVRLRFDPAIRSTPAGSALARASAQLMRAYGLAEAGYRLQPGEAAEWEAGFRAAHGAGQWLVMPLWKPHWMHRAYALRALAEPRDALGGDNRGVLLANRRAYAMLPERTRQVLERISLGIEDVEEMDFAVSVRQASPQDVARAFLERDGLLESWLE